MWIAVTMLAVASHCASTIGGWRTWRVMRAESRHFGELSGGVFGLGRSLRCCGGRSSSSSSAEHR